DTFVMKYVHWHLIMRCQRWTKCPARLLTTTVWIESSPSLAYGSNHEESTMYDVNYDVVVVGAGHAGCEAAHAAARMGLSTALYTMNVDLIAQMSCNPAVGGIAKGHLVREIDALGGIMALAADEAGIQFRLLNTSRGPAVWSPRAQEDKAGYRYVMRRLIAQTPNLFIRQAEVVEILFEKNRIAGIELLDGRRVAASAVILTTGTFLNGLIHIGEKRFTAGRNGEPASIALGNSIRNLGFD